MNCNRSEEDIERDQAEADKLVQIKSLNVLMSVVKRVVSSRCSSLPKESSGG
jgi:hypothetical protein